MVETIYNKLIRDNIPDIITAQGRKPVVSKLNNEDYIHALHQKLQEEVAEYLEDNRLEELCDMLEVIFSIAKAKGYSIKDIEACRDSKNLKNGAFDKKLYLEKVIAEDTLC